MVNRRAAVRPETEAPPTQDDITSLVTFLPPLFSQADALETAKRHALKLINSVVRKLLNAMLGAGFRQWFELYRASKLTEEQKKHAASLVLRTLQRMQKGMLAKGWNGWWAAVDAQRDAEEAALRKARDEEYQKQALEMEQRRALAGVTKTLERLMNKMLAMGMNKWKDLVADLLRAARKRSRR